MDSKYFPFYCRCLAKIRATVDGCTRNNLAASAPVFWFDVTMATISSCCCIVSLGLRPPTRPSFRAASRPFFVRSRSMARSNSANEPTICIIIRPAGVDVSIDSVRLWKSAPAESIFSRVKRRSFSERERRSSFQTTSTSPLRSCSSKRCSSGRSHRPPETFS